jgi:hypothetical protein
VEGGGRREEGGGRRVEGGGWEEGGRREWSGGREGRRKRGRMNEKCKKKNTSDRKASISSFRSLSDIFAPTKK